jgi:hypothetical protein
MAIPTGMRTDSRAIKANNFFVIFLLVKFYVYFNLNFRRSSDNAALNSQKSFRNRIAGGWVTVPTCLPRPRA